MAVTDEAIEKIKEMIVAGRLRPGDRLPKEDELAARLGLSRSSLREAVRALSLVRILDVRQGDGTYVTSLSPAVLLDAVSFVVDFHRDDSVLNFLEVRRVLEPYAVSLVARSATPEQVAELRRLLDEVTPSSPPERFVENDREFHRRVNSFCGNAVLISLLDSLSGPMHRARVWRGVTDPNALERTRAEHLAIVDALEAHQPDIAAARAVVHIAGVEEWLRRVQASEVAVGGPHRRADGATPGPPASARARPA
ncbi:MAG TPA: FadR/GntR family transcriptional regulator [Acidimicrobiales bacterium]|jgi:GntR family transcriptional repressor for pyruvate dehydrogenase complex|nr:FadR/GntR family transcriptional regulator [Acidimicrobiales bacterium]